MASARTLPALLLLALAAVALPAQAAPPPDAFCVILIEGVDDFRLVRVLVDEETNLTEREALFEAIDADGSGSVTPEEQRAFRQANMTRWQRPDRLGLRTLSLSDWDASVPPLYAMTWRQVGHTFHKQNHTTPSTITDPADLETQEVREVRFEPRARAPGVILHGGVDPDAPPATTTTTSTGPTPTPTAVIEYVVVRAPPGWIVSSVDGWSYEGSFRVEPRQREVDLPAFDTKRPYSVSFVRVPESTETATVTETVTETETVTVPEGPDGGSRGAPAAPPFAALAVAVAGALAVRRRLRP